MKERKYKIKRKNRSGIVESCNFMASETVMIFSWLIFVVFLALLVCLGNLYFIFIEREEVSSITSEETGSLNRQIGI